MSEFRRAATVTAILAVLGCGEEQQTPASGSNAAPTLPQVSWSVDPAPRLSLGEGERMPLHRVADAMLLAGDTIVVADGAPRVMVFDGSGLPVRTLGQEGEGPGEFRAIEWIHHISPDTLLVYDPQLRRLTYFSGGELERMVTPAGTPDSGRRPGLLGVFADGSLLASELLPPELESPLPESFSVRVELRLLLYNEAGTFVRDLGTVSGPEFAYAGGVRVPMEFDRSTLFEVGEASFYVAPAEEFRASVFDQHGAKLRDLEKEHTPIAVETSDSEAPRLPDGTELPRPAFYPAISAIILDEAGHLWVRPFTREETDDVRWSVFDSIGRPRGSVVLPPRFEPTQIGEDFVLGISQDHMDVESVQLYRLLRSN